LISGQPDQLIWRPTSSSTNRVPIEVRGKHVPTQDMLSLKDLILKVREKHTLSSKPTTKPTVED